jgi:hypothetical protein
MLRNLRKIVDETDVQRAKEIYNEVEFAAQFSYRKGNRTLILRKPALIARKLRRIQNERPRFWDYPEDEEEENED